jgi:hypothetical protein
VSNIRKYSAYREIEISPQYRQHSYSVRVTLPHLPKTVSLSWWRRIQS